MPFRLSLECFGFSFAFLSVWNHQKDNLILTNWVMFWNLSRVYFFFFILQNITSNRYIFVPRLFPINFFWEKFYSTPVIFIYKWFNFRYTLWIFFDLFIINGTVTVYQKHLLSFLLMGFIVAFLVCIQSGESISDPPLFGFIMILHWIYIRNTIADHSWRQTHYLSLILN